MTDKKKNLTILQRIKNIWQQIKDFFTERPFEGVVIVFFIVIFISLMVRGFCDDSSYFFDKLMGTDGESNAKYQTLRSLALLLAGLVGLLGLFISNRRAKAQAESVKEQAKSVEEQARSVGAQTKSADAQAKSVEEQVKANENKTFHEATGHLGHSSSSVRLVGIYILYDLALSKPKKRLKNIIEILSAHVRATTQEEEYQKKYKKKPSDEISSLLKLLSNLNVKYLSENEEEKWYPLDLSNAYLCGVILQEVDFRKANLIRSNFEGAYLYKSNFANVNLYESKFEHADLVGSNFGGANLIGSRFTLAKLKESHFEGAFLEESHFEDATLTKSHFTGAKLERSHFTGAKLERSNFGGANLIGSRFTLAKLKESNFEGAFLEESHFEDATLTKSHFTGAKLERSHFTGAKLERSHFRGATLTKSHFERADLKESCFEGAYLQESRFEDARLYVSYFEGADLSKSHFEGAFLEESSFRSVILYGSHFEGANLKESHFEGANLLGSHFEGFLGDLMCFSGDFRKRIKNRIGKKANIGNRMIFAGGITEEDIKALKKITEDTLPHFTDDDRREKFKKCMNHVIEVLKTHQDKGTSREIPEDVKGSISLGELTEYRANEIIKNYDEIMKQYDKVIKKCKKNDK